MWPATEVARVGPTVAYRTGLQAAQAREGSSACSGAPRSSSNCSEPLSLGSIPTLRVEVETRAQMNLFGVSLSLLVRWLSLVRRSDAFVGGGRVTGFIRLARQAAINAPGLPLARLSWLGLRSPFAARRATPHGVVRHTLRRCRQLVGTDDTRLCRPERWMTTVRRHR